MSDPLQGSNGPDLTLGTPVDSLADGVPLLGHVGSSAIILVRRADAISAIGATCGHYGGPLAEGLVVDDTVRCPWHHACFSLRTGEALRAPALNPVPCYAVVERDGRVFVTGKQAAPGSVRRRVPRGAPLPRSVAIVGAGAAGNSAAEELRHLGFDGAITLIDQDRQAPYDRPNLSKDYLAGTAPQEWLPLHPRAYYEERGVALALGRRITALDPARKRLTWDDGTTREFGAIVLAPGAEPIRLDIAGDGPPIHYLRTHAGAICRIPTLQMDRQSRGALDGSDEASLHRERQLVPADSQEHGCAGSAHLITPTVTMILIAIRIACSHWIAFASSKPRTSLAASPMTRSAL